MGRSVNATVPSHPLADLVCAGEFPGIHRLFDFRQVLGGCCEQLLALAGPLGGQDRVAAADEPFTRVIGVGDLGEVVLVEQAPLALST
jgi:hypothetical protein